MELAKGNIGPEAAYDLEFTGGSLVASVKYTGTQATASVALSFSADLVLEALVKKIAPGAVGQEVLALIEAAMKGI